MNLLMAEHLSKFYFRERLSEGEQERMAIRLLRNEDGKITDFLKIQTVNQLLQSAQLFIF